MTLILLTALFLYINPSNAVFIAALGIMHVILKRKLPYDIIIGTIVAHWLYFPLIRQITQSHQLGAAQFNLSTLTGAVPEVLHGFISYRYLIIPFAIYGLFKTKFKREVKLAIGMIILPVILFFIQGGHIYGRLMLPAIPFFCLLLAIGLDIYGKYL